jgi:hypothetical protein
MNLSARRRSCLDKRHEKIAKEMHGLYFQYMARSTKYVQTLTNNLAKLAQQNKGWKGDCDYSSPPPITICLDYKCSALRQCHWKESGQSTNVLLSSPLENICPF